MASINLKRSLCEILEERDLDVTQLENLKKRLSNDLVAIDDLINQKINIIFDTDKDCYIIQQDNKEIETANMREKAVAAIALKK